MRKYDGQVPDNDIFSDILDEIENGEDIDEMFITTDDIINMILVEYYIFKTPVEEICQDWDLTEKELYDLLKANPITPEELEELRKYYYEE
uniref:Uncharacterized protein n=1 Tax=candidate division CPR3 bacterium TaxID=2268181 RepID=A0A7C5UVU2_UNCC3